MSQIPMTVDGEVDFTEASAPQIKRTKDGHEQLTISRMMGDPGYTALAQRKGLQKSHYKHPIYAYLFGVIAALFQRSRTYGLRDIIEHIREDQKLDRVGNKLLYLIPEDEREREVKRYHSLGAAALHVLHSFATQEDVPAAYIDTLITSFEARAFVANMERAAAMVQQARDVDLPGVLPQARAIALASGPVRSEDMVQHVSQRILSMKYTSARVGVRTGYARLDTMAGPMSPGLIVVAGNSGSGKSGLVTTMATQMALHEDTAVVLFTLDDNGEDMSKKLVYSLAQVEIPASEITLTSEENGRIEKASDDLSKAPIWIDDRRFIAPHHIETVLLSVRAEIGPQKKLVAVLDYLQLFKGNGDGKDASQELKDIGERCGVPIVATSTLIERYRPKKSTEGETLGHDAPQLVDVKEPIREAANRVILVHNYAAVHRSETFFDSQARVTAEERVVLIVAKNKRGGSVGRVEATFLPHLSLFRDTPPAPPPEPPRVDDATLPDAYAGDMEMGD